MREKRKKWSRFRIEKKELSHDGDKPNESFSLCVASLFLAPTIAPSVTGESLLPP